MTSKQTAGENSGGGKTAEGDETPTTKRRLMRVPTYRALPSERFGWDAHIAVLKNLVLRSRFGEQAVDTDVVEEGIRTQSASLNVNFLVDAGLATKEKRKYRPTEECIQFVRLYSVDEPRARQVLRSVLERTWFANVAKHTLQLTSSANEDQLVKELAVDSGVVEIAPKERAFRVLLEYMVYCGLLTREGSQLTWGYETSGSLAVQATVQPSTTLPQQLQAPSHGPGGSAPSAANQDWVHRNWPGQFDLWIRPHPSALRLVKNALDEVEKSLSMPE